MTIRITVQRACFNKIGTQLRRNRNGDMGPVIRALDNTKQTLTPKKDTILWEPSKPLCKALADILTKEQTFSRKPESAAYALAETNIARLYKYAEST